MKKTIVTMCISGLAVLGLSSMKEAASSIKGKVTPVDGAEAVWAIKDADTLKSTISSEGTFSIEVQPGTYKLVVSAKAPYKNAEIKDLVVTADSSTDAGEIKLEK